MKTLIAVTALTSLLSGAVFAQSSNIAHDAYRFVNNASAISHVNAATHEQNTDEKNKDIATPFSEMNEHERAIIAHSFMNNSASYPHQKMIEEHKKMLNESEANTKNLSFSELNAGEKAALIHESVNNAGAEAHQIQAKKLRELYESGKQ
ncbi:TPA: copper resistance protein [Citrobacter freundii]|nr:copper resistance protein [Citrobacter freundii]